MGVFFMEKGFILSLIFAAIIAIFALNNSASVLVDFVFTEVEMSQAIVILISAIFGAVVAAIFSGVRSLKTRKKIRGLESEAHELEEKNKVLALDLQAKDTQIKNLSKEIVNSPYQGVNVRDEDKKNRGAVIVDEKLLEEKRNIKDEN